MFFVVFYVLAEILYPYDKFKNMKKRIKYFYGANLFS